MTIQESDSRLSLLLEDIDLPEGAYEQAEKRYEDLAAWISRPDSTLAPFDAHIFVQGSFAFGTAIRPLVEEEEYDLDFSCKLREGISRDTHTQKQLKDMLGVELASYRKARNIVKPLTEKNRCWRLGYRDQLPFHLDVVPGIRADAQRRRELGVLMEARGMEGTLAQEVARRALWITDRNDENYKQISPNWPSSNPGGYQLWFASRMRSTDKKLLADAQVDPVPVYRSKTPLQQVVQLLKRHRDALFSEYPDCKPVSIILTTIAGRAYQHGEGLSQTMRRVLAELERVRLSDTNDILNPVNSQENFADRWPREDCAHLQLKKNFHDWVKEANRHFHLIMDGTDLQMLVDAVEDGLAVNLTEEHKRRLSRLGVVSAVPIVRKVNIDPEPPRPWSA